VTTNEQSNKNKWIWIGLGAALLFCCCAALVAFLVLRQAGKTIEEGINADPEAAAQAAHEIVDYDLPPGYQEQSAINIMFYSLVMIGPEPSTNDGPMIMLAQFSQVAGSQQEMEEQIRRSFEQQSGNRSLDMQVVEVQKKTIRGAEVEVTIYEGADSNNNVVRQLLTTFPGKDGTAMLMIMGPAQTWDQDLIDAFIESIR